MSLYSIVTIAAVIALSLIFVARRPSTFHIERQITVAALPQTVFDHVNDFHAWRAWSPWDKLDPQMQRTFTGPESGVGANYAWLGNRKVGEGQMTIERSNAPSDISIRLQFVKPFSATHTANFNFTPIPQGTLVVWVMDGKNNFMSKAFGLIMNMDKLVGGDFERGLASLKAVAESQSTAAAALWPA